MTGRARSAPPLVLMVVASLAAFGIGTWGVTSWSLIPVELDGRIARIEYYSDTGLHYSQVHLDDGRTVVVDHEIVEAVGGRHDAIGRRVVKGAGERTLAIDAERVDLHLTESWWRTTAALAVVVALASARAWRRRQPSG